MWRRASRPGQRSEGHGLPGDHVAAAAGRRRGAAARSQREGLDAFEQIGEEASGVVEHGPSALVMVWIVRPKIRLQAGSLCRRDD